MFSAGLTVLSVNIFNLKIVFLNKSIYNTAIYENRCVKMNVFVVTLIPDASVDKIWEILEARGAEFLFSEEDTATQKIYLKATAEMLEHPSIMSVDPYEIPEIDWNAQWEGRHELELAPFGFPDKIIHMTPGSGFGDLSHPTTRLICRMMSTFLQGKKVLDIGSGSGILSFTAKAMGALEVIGVEIDETAIRHANANAYLNAMEVKFCLPEEKFAFSPDVALMNMIMVEQKLAWQSVGSSFKGILLTSGVLEEQKEEYLEWAKLKGWQLKEVVQEEDWLGFIFLI